jgi:hypothetical protein
LVIIRCTQAGKFVPATKDSLALIAFIATSCTKSSVAARFLVRGLAALCMDIICPLLAIGLVVLASRSRSAVYLCRIVRFI